MEQEKVDYLREMSSLIAEVEKTLSFLHIQNDYFGRFLKRERNVLKKGNIDKGEYLISVDFYNELFSELTKESFWLARDILSRMLEYKYKEPIRTKYFLVKPSRELNMPDYAKGIVDIVIKHFNTVVNAINESQGMLTPNEENINSILKNRGIANDFIESIENSRKELKVGDDAIKEIMKKYVKVE